MSRPKNPEQARVLEAVKKHLATHGSTNWDMVLRQFPHVPESSIWRWIRSVKKEVPDRPELINAKSKVMQKTKHAINARTVEAKINGTSHIAKHIPAAPSPQYIAQSGAQGMANLDVMSEINLLYRDATMLRQFGIKENEDGSESIKNPAVFEKSIQRRADLLETAINAMREVWELGRMDKFYNAIVDAIAQTDPATQRRIMVVLADLDAQYGMTMSMPTHRFP